MADVFIAFSAQLAAFSRPGGLVHVGVALVRTSTGRKKNTLAQHWFWLTVD